MVPLLNKKKQEKESFECCDIRFSHLKKIIFRLGFPIQVGFTSAQFRTVARYYEQLRAIPRNITQQNSDWKP